RRGPGQTAGQGNTEAARRGADGTERRARGGEAARTRAGPRRTDSSEHAGAEGEGEQQGGDRGGERTQNGRRENQPRGQREPASASPGSHRRREEAIAAEVEE
ncbi:hypothetical protein C3R44_23510, partial [Mycobacterium tuberculosis]